MKSVGAGGGSIARVDAGGLLHVGPESAGAVPGPVCYGRGGTRPTVTDASLALGFLDPDFFLGGAMKLDLAGARTAIDRDVATPLGVSVEEAAWSIIHLSTENMVQAIADITVAQGIDPAKSVLIGGGGAAGLNSTFIARRLGCERLIIPETGAALSAAGAMMSEVTGEFAASLFTSTARFDYARVNAALADLTAQCVAFAHRAGDPLRSAEPVIVAEARYENQVWDIDVTLPLHRFAGEEDVDHFRRTFDAAHRQIFTIDDPSSAVEIVGLRATIRCQVRPFAEFRLSGNQALAQERRRSAWFKQTGWTDSAIHRLEAMETDCVMSGPCIIESAFTTIVVDPGATVQRSASGSILIHPNGQA